MQVSLYYYVMINILLIIYCGCCPLEHIPANCGCWRENNNMHHGPDPLIQGLSLHCWLYSCEPYDAYQCLPLRKLFNWYKETVLLLMQVVTIFLLKYFQCPSTANLVSFNIIFLKNERHLFHIRIIIATGVYLYLSQLSNEPYWLDLN